jgi:hypothetical protein
MQRFSAFAIGFLVFLAPTFAQAQQMKEIKERMEKNLLLEKESKYREAYVEWSKFLKIPAISGDNLRDEKVQKIYFAGYFYHARTIYKMATTDPKIKDRQRFIDFAAKMIENLERAKSKDGWKIAGPMFEEFLKEGDSDQLKQAYEKLKSDRKKRDDARTP